MNEGIEYLERIKQRNLAYEEVRTDVIKYLFKKEIKDNTLTTDLFIIAFLFEAKKQGETLSEKDICILLGEDDSEFEEDFSVLDTFTLVEGHEDMSLEEVLDLTVENNQC